MGFRFQKRISLFPGFRLNLSKSGVSASVGPRGADVNVGPHGAFLNAGLPGTGLSYRHKIGGVTHGDPPMTNENNIPPTPSLPAAADSSPSTGNQRLLGWITVLITVAAVGVGGYWLGSRNNAPQNFPLGAPSVSTPLNDAAPQQQAAAPSSAAAGQTASPETRHYRHAADGGGAVAAILSAAKPASGTRYVHRNNSALHAQPTYASPLLKKEPKGTTVTLLALSDKWAKIKDGAVVGWMRASVLGENPPGTRKPRHRKED